LKVFVFILAAIIIGRLFYIQVISGKFYQAQALGQQAGFKEIQGERGQVFLSNSRDSKGEADTDDTKSLAINQDDWLAYAVSSQIQDKETFADVLSKIIGGSKDSILSKMSQSDSYAIIEKNLSQSQVDSLKKLNLANLYFQDNPSRLYPQKNVASQVIGFLGGDGIGQYGIEGYYDSQLAGESGIDEQLRGLNSINSSTDASYLNGSDVYLTIDYNIQFEAERLLQAAKKDVNIDSGQIIVMKPDTGKILAIAHYPSFDPNNYSAQRDFSIFQNSTTQKIFEPGSVFKPFTMAMGLQEGRITPETTFVDTGSVTIGHDTAYNFDHKAYGLQDMSGILEKSINVGAVWVEQKIPHQTFMDYVDKFGFTKKTGVTLQGEVSSQNQGLRNGSDFQYVTASFGQGIEMTPLQLTSAFCMFANGGNLVKPYIVSKVVHGADEVNTQPQVQNVISSKTASEVTTMLTNVVKRGFGTGAGIPGYYLAGKTGTAQVPYPDRKGYYPDRTIQSFVGFGPALNPQFLILVKLDDPKVPESSLSAAPVFRKMAQYIIDYWQISPDY